MRRVVAAVVVVGQMLAAHAVSAEAKTPYQRTVKLEYEGGAVPFVCIDCPKTTSRTGEKFLSVKVIDDVSPVGYVDIVWDTKDGHDYFGACGATEEPRRIPSGTRLTAHPNMAPDFDCLDGASTTGTIVLTFTK